jgi:hypothetical protein
MLSSFVGSWQSLAKDHQQNWWPRHYEQDEDHYGRRPSFASLTGNTVRFFDSIIGKIICFAIIVALIFGCGKLAFQYDYLYTGLFTLMAFAAYCAWIAIFLRFFDPFIPVIRM